MENQKLFLIIAIFLTVFILWDKWQIKDQDNIDTNNKAQVSDNLPEQNADLPKISTNVTNVDPIVDVSDETNFTKVVTDLLTIEINHKGGNIQNAFLNNYSDRNDEQKKLHLLSNKRESLLQAQSGLASNGLLPTISSKFNSIQDSYVLNSDTLTVPFTWEDKSKKIKVIKNFHFKQGSYVVKVDYQIENNSDKEIPVKSYVRLIRGANDDSNFFMPTFVGGAIYDKATHKVQKNDLEDWNDFKQQNAMGGWTAMIQQYFISAWIPNQNQPQILSASTSNNTYRLTNENQQINIMPASSVTLETNNLYLGPKEYGKIEQIATGLNYTLDYGWLDILASPLSWLIHKINNFVNSWGLSIIIITIFIKVIFYPLSEKSYRSMAGMRKISSRIKTLRDTYGEDKKKLSQKTMELYKQEKINPAAGCLPILLQIPVFIAFYWMLLDTVELRNTEFWWLDDLSSKDSYYILPVIMGVSMFIQQKLNPPPTDPTQAKIMMMLPFIFTVLFLWFPSGLVLYWVTNNILSIAQQWTINKRINA
jgi:YidC/Oxa1 family membrane protein insertase